MPRKNVILCITHLIVIRKLIYVDTHAYICDNSRTITRKHTLSTLSYLNKLSQLGSTLSSERYTHAKHISRVLPKHK